MYYKTHVNIKRRVDLKNSLAECMWVELKTKLQNILISIIYRSEIQSHHRFGTSLMVCWKVQWKNLIIWYVWTILNKNFLNLQSNINDLISSNGLYNTLLYHPHRSFYLFALEYRQIFFHQKECIFLYNTKLSRCVLIQYHNLQLYWKYNLHHYKDFSCAVKNWPGPGFSFISPTIISV
jgi:hypothetical protein